MSAFFILRQAHNAGRRPSWKAGAPQDENNMSKTTALPTVRRVDGHPAVQAAKKRVTQAREAYDKVNDDAAGAAALLRERRHALALMQARVALGDAKQAEFDQLADQVRQIEARTAVYGDHEASKAEFIAPYEAERERARTEAAKELGAQYAAAIEPRLKLIRDAAPALLQAAEEVLRAASDIEASNRGADGPAQIRKPWKNGDLERLRRLAHVLAQIIEG